MRRCWIWVLLALAAAFYLTVSSRYAPGLYIDDALYILLARALRHGQFAHLYLPTPVPEIHHLPGYPLILSPLDLISGGSWAFLRAFSAICILAGALLIYRRSDPFLRPLAKGIVVVLFLFNALLSELTTAIMPEPVFILLSLLSVYLYGDAVEKKRARIWFGIALSLAVATRPQGMCLLAAIVLWTVGARQMRRIWPPLLAAASVGALIFVRASLVKSQIGSYVSFSMAGLKTADGIAYLFSRFKAVMGVLFPQTIYQAPAIWDPGARAALAWGCIGLSAALMAVAWRYRRNPVIGISAIYILVSMAALTLWPLVNPRFSLPVLPFALLTLAAGADALAERNAVAKRLALLLAAVILWAQLQLDFRWVLHANTLRQMQANPMPVQTYEWIKRETKPTDVLLTLDGAVIFLYTGRRSVLWFPAGSPEEFKARLRNFKIDYALLSTPSRYLNVADPTNAALVVQMQWLRQFEGAKKIYENMYERTEVIKLNL